MVQSMVSVVGISPMVWVSIPHMGTQDPLGESSLALCSLSRYALLKSGLGACRGGGVSNRSMIWMFLRSMG